MYLLRLQPMSDSRGCFTRLFCEQELAELLGSRRIVQINYSSTCEPGSVRGLHFQRPPHTEIKMVTCLHGAVFDVAVDLRTESPTFLQWVGIELNAGNSAMVLIPEGCAHGFQVLERDSELLYLHTAFYTPDVEGGIRFDDPQLRIAWPHPVTEVSERDRRHPLIESDFHGIVV